jgi:hypothetical protein
MPTGDHDTTAAGASVSSTIHTLSSADHLPPPANPIDQLDPAHEAVRLKRMVNLNTRRSPKPVKIVTLSGYP